MNATPIDSTTNAAPQGSPSVAPADSEFGSAAGPAGAAPMRSACPYCTSDNEAIRDTYYDQTCEGCVKRMFSA